MPFASKKQLVAYQKAKYHERMLYIMDIKQKNKCVMCGYNKHPEILEYYNKNNTSRAFRVSFLCSSEKKFKKTIDNLKFICPNCNRWKNNALNAEDGGKNGG